MTTLTVIVGPRRHGVIEHAERIAGATGTDVIRAARPDMVPAVAHHAVSVHLHYTDQLFGADTEAAASAFLRLTHQWAGRLVVTLHDLPTPDASPRFRRRAASYDRVATQAAAVIVSSEHERRCLNACGIDRPVDVIPLPIVPAGVTRPRRSGSGRVVAVLGYVYPGKGHEEVIDAAADVGADVVALGRPSPGHEGMVDELAARAIRRRCRFSVTGYLPTRRLDEMISLVDVPVVPATAPSASSSLARWLGAGRRPLTAASAYATEVAAAGDDLVVLYPPGDLATALRWAIDDPLATWRQGPVPRGRRLDAVAAAHLDVYARVAAGQSHILSRATR